MCVLRSEHHDGLVCMRCMRDGELENDILRLIVDHLELLCGHLLYLLPSDKARAVLSRRAGLPGEGEG